MEVRVTAQSQTHRLRERMQEAGVAHGDVVRADLRNVRAMVPVGSATAQVFFCNIQPLAVRARLSQGDGGPLPDSAEVDRAVLVPGAGLYDILDVHISSNGTVRVSAGPYTRVVPAEQVRPDFNSLVGM